jgi:alpha-tubulin suppressor-like RCC1 family protein
MGRFARRAVALPLVVAALGAMESPAATFSAGTTHNLVATAARQVWGWGSNDYGKLGNATSVSSSVPVRAGALTDVIAVAAGADHSLALRADGTVWAWGLATAAESCVLYDVAGNPNTVGCSKVPRQVAGLSGVAAIAAGGAGNLALLSDGSVRRFSPFAAPSSVSGISSVTAIAAGDEFFMALRSNGTVWTWGAGTNGELGTGSTTPQMCNVRETYGGTPADRPCAITPVQVASLTNVVAIAAGGRHALVLRSDGSVRTWGSNHYGQMADGTATNRFTPHAPSNLTNVVQIAAGFNHSLALKSDGSVWAWGMNNHGQLGMAAMHTCTQAGYVAVPCNRLATAASAHSGPRSIVAGGAHSIAVRQDGTLDAFGLNTSGQLGHGVPFPAILAAPGGIDPHKFILTFSSPSVPSGATLGTTSGSGGLDLDSVDAGLEFGPQAVGTSSAPREIRFTNLQTVPITITGILASGDFSRTHNCPSSLPTNAGCNINITFRPSAAGQRQGTMTVSTNAPDAPTVDMALQGTGGTAPAAVAQNYSDIWWNPGESGWGVTIADHETNIFAVWYTYEASGKPTWFTIPGGTLSADRRYFSGDLWSTTGPCYSAASFNPAQVVAVRRGSVNLDFAPTDLPAGWARFTGTIGTTSWSKAIRRMDIFGNAAPNWGSDYTDIWWNSTQSGWGLTLAQHGNNVFGVLYTYDCDGSPLFVTMPGVSFSFPTQFSGDLYTTRSSGSWYGSATFNPAHITATRVGSATFSIGGQVATFTPTINGATRASLIWPLPFGNRAPGTP